jgi:very-short-patch-repair endonuclease
MKKTLSIVPPEDRTEAPKLQKKGRGWNIAESRLDTLHETAREMRRSPTQAQAHLGEALIAANLGKYRFRRQVVIGSAIVDFACQALKLAVEIDEPDANAELDRRRDASLAEVGTKVLRFPAAEVLGDVEAVTQTIVAALKARYDEQRARPRPGGRGGYKGDRRT